MNRQYVFTVVVLLAVAGATAGVYQFYFKEQLETFAENRNNLDLLQKQLQTLQKTFDKTKPDVIVRMWRGAVIPWSDAVTQRATFFNLKEVYETEPMPEGELPRFYYEKESNRLIAQIQNAAYTRNPPCHLPAVVYAQFGAPQMSQLTGQAVTREDVELWLQRIRQGCFITKMLLDAKVITIGNIVLWPKRVEGGVLELHTVGVSVMMTARNLIAFTDALRMSERFTQLNAISVSNPHLRYSSDPVLQVQMLFTLGRYLEPPPGSADALGGTVMAAAGASPQAQLGAMRRSIQRTATPAEPEKKWWHSLWPF